MADNPLITASRAASRAATKAPPQEYSEDRSSLATRIAGGVLSPIAAIGNVFDLPGSMGRDVLTGQNPLDQLGTAWWKDSGNRATGRDVLTRLGVAPNDPHRWEAADVGGFLTEVALDPLTYLSGGLSAATKGAGGAARAAGLMNKLSRVDRMTKTPRNLIADYAAKYGDEMGRTMERQFSKTAAVRGHNVADIIDKPVGHLMRVHLPFSNIGFGVNNKYIAGALDKLQKKASESLPGRLVGSAFDYAAKGATKVKDQLYNRGLTSTLEETSPIHFLRGTELGQKIGGVRERFAKEMAPHFDAASTNAMLAGKDPQKAFDKAMIEAFETHGDQNLFEDAFLNTMQRRGVTPSPELTQEAVDMMAEVRRHMDDRVVSLITKGKNIGENQPTPIASYFPREMSDEYAKARGVKATGESHYGTRATKPRVKSLAKVPTHVIESIRENPSRYLDAKHGPANINQDFQKYLGYSERKDVTMPDPKSKTGYSTSKVEFPITKEEHAKQLVGELGRIDPAIPMYKDTPIEDLVFNYNQNTGRIDSTLDYTHRFVKDHLDDGKHIAVEDAYRKLGLRKNQSLEQLGKLVGVTNPKDLKKLGKRMISKEAFDALSQHQKPGWKMPEFFNEMMKPVDKVTQMYKTNWTMPSIPFHVRNLSGGTINDVIAGPHEGPGGALQYMARKGQEMMGQGRFEPKHQGAMLDMRAHGVLNDEQKAFQDVAMTTMDPLRGNPLNVKQAWKEGGDKATDNKWYGQDTPYIGKPVGVANQVHKAVINMGEKAAGMVEYHNRAGMYKHLVENKGYSPQQAAREVEKLQFLYDKATPFEKEFMKRAFPFYGFISNQTKITAKTLAENPGGAAAQLIRAQDAGRDPEDVMPPHIADTMAIPLGTSPDGTKSYLSGFGNPMEAAAPILALPMLQSSGALDIASASNPLIKWPAELATGQTFFQKGAGGGGRPLRDLDPAVGRIIKSITGSTTPPDQWLGDPGLTRHVEHILANTPISKYIGMLKQATDQRDIPAWEKASNFLLPVQTHHVDTQAQERALQAASNEMADYLGAKSWSNRYFNEEQIARAEKRDPNKAKTMRAMNALWSEAKRNVKKYKKGGTKKARTKSEPGMAQTNELLRAAGL